LEISQNKPGFKIDNLHFPETYLNGPRGHQGPTAQALWALTAHRTTARASKALQALKSPKHGPQKTNRPPGAHSTGLLE
jgi:hypothetical protein